MATELEKSILEASGTLGQFIAKPYYDRDLDSLFLYIANRQSVAKRINPILTLFLSTEDHSLVGVKVKGVRRILELAGNFGVIVGDKKIKIGIFLAFALAPPPESDSDMDNYERELEDMKDLELDESELAAC